MSEEEPKTFYDENLAQTQGYVRKTEASHIIVEDDRTGMSVETFKRALIDHLKCSIGMDLQHASLIDIYHALSFVVRDRLMDRWIKTARTARSLKAKIVAYLSAEFLIGRQLGNNLLNVGCFKAAREALNDLGYNIYDILEQESEPGLGNGGLGRLAACFLDSLATLNIPSIGYGIRYEFGIFEQGISDGWQVEKPDKWLRFGTPWEVQRPQLTVEVWFGGYTEKFRNENGQEKTRWIPARTVLGTPHDTMVPGFSTNMVNTLRLWAAGTSQDFNFEIFDAGDYNRAVSEKTYSENISKVLYPNDNTPQGRELRLEQQYFFVSSSLQDMIRRHRARIGSLENFHEYNAIQLNDTHPAIAVAELMRLLIDVHDMDWNTAWHVTTNTLAYTNHTLLSEALERWPVDMLGSMLPRHLEIIYGINQRFLDEVRLRFPNEDDRISRMSIVEEGEVKRIRMANLATIGSHSVNGVAAMHSELVKHQLLRDFYELTPQKFNNKTNGVTPRRFLMLCNPKLSFLISEMIGKDWLRNAEELRKLEAHIDDTGFLATWEVFKEENKGDLAAYIQHFNGINVSEESIFDIQVKRLHEYKRQLLNIMHVIALYNRIRNNSKLEIQPRTVIFGAKAAPGYFMAKLIIKLINSVADVVNNDPACQDRLKVVFLRNFCVSLGERVYPAADLSEQISLAGKEASGTGNMKFALNGALTIGTLDGANIEIRDAVGAENFFLFGLTLEDVQRLKSSGYNPWVYYNSNPELKDVIDSISSGVFSHGDRDLFRPIVDSLLNRDEYLLCADFQSYVDTQTKVAEAFQDKQRWTRMSVLNVARSGCFSSDRSIREYCDDIWGVKPIDVEL
ncbi:MAG: glycogen/starch/alpha-glucan phosphorylase [SAR324 cluster bacterium]|uniref:Alpha-1,4 glucan phosphorylase n=1 Tax=SAR324 cluster bacterium TaxID=2024889 RepID=A0A7X9IJ71_9DELT|nr:glycogen/starch/alpha-glucan phosphorylase [SAR324 cluster bacterium]